MTAGQMVALIVIGALIEFIGASAWWRFQIIKVMRERDYWRKRAIAAEDHANMEVDGIGYSIRGEQWRDQWGSGIPEEVMRTEPQTFSGEMTIQIPPDGHVTVVDAKLIDLTGVDDPYMDFRKGDDGV